MKGINSFIGTHSHVIGDYLTYADFILHCYYHNFTLAMKTVDSGYDFEKYPNINRVVHNFRNDHKLKTIVEENDKLPFIPPSVAKIKW